MKKKHFGLLSPLLTVLANLLIAYVVYFIARLAFLAENYAVLARQTGLSHLLNMLFGGIVFDTSAILYTNALWVVMVLFPLHLKERHVYHRVCRWVFVIINTLALVVNLADAVYFQYTLRRTTTTVFNEFSNESNLGGIFATEMLNHWYFFILAIAIVYGMWRCYRISPLNYRQLSWKTYMPAMLVSLLAFTPFCIAGMRGGWTRAVRPITISNANNYCDHPSEMALVLNTPFSLIRTIGKNVYEVPHYFATEEELAAVFNPVHQPHPTRPFVKKNVVVIIIESFGREYIGAYNKHIPGYKGFTPFTDSLIANGALTYTHSYCNGRKSIDGMPSILSSIPMFVEPFFLSP